MEVKQFDQLLSDAQRYQIMKVEDELKAEEMAIILGLKQEEVG